jgi:hypothetical protein
MIIPTQITNFKRSPMELLQFAVFAVCVAGKNADQTAKKVNALWRDQSFRTTLSVQFERYPQTAASQELYIKWIRKHLMEHKIGQYDRISSAVMWLNQYSGSLHTMTWEGFMKIKGIGPKTAAFFILHSRETTTTGIPVIDTHVVKYMASKGETVKVTSVAKKYLEYAKRVAFWLQQDFPNMSMADADLLVWKRFSGREV